MNQRERKLRSSSSRSEIKEPKHEAKWTEICLDYKCLFMFGAMKKIEVKAQLTVAERRDTVPSNIPMA